LIPVFDTCDHLRLPTPRVRNADGREAWWMEAGVYKLFAYAILLARFAFAFALVFPFFLQLESKKAIGYLV